MKQWMLMLCFALLSTNTFSRDSSLFDVCESTYALCTSAVCEPANGKINKASCHCDVRTGYSASQKECSSLQETPQGTLLDSRYYPVRGYKICSNSRAWAYCLDAPCKLDPKNPGKAFCLCSLMKNKGDYVLVTDKKINANCDSGIISSATVQQITHLSEFLTTQEPLQPFAITVQP